VLSRPSKSRVEVIPEPLGAVAVVGRASGL